MPDRVLLWERGQLASIPYSELELGAGDTQCIEQGNVGRDCEIVGWTWCFVNRDGGPDLRFKNNRQLPVVRYGQLRLRAPGLAEQFLQVSQQEPIHALQRAVAALAVANAASVTNSTVEQSERAAAKPPQARPSLPADDETQGIGSRPRLFARLLEVEVASTKARYIGSSYALEDEMLDEANVVYWCKDRMDELNDLFVSLQSELGRSDHPVFGSSGAVEAREAIEESAAAVGSLYDGFLDWTRRVRGVPAEGLYAELAHEISTLSASVIAEIESMGPRLLEAVAEAKAAGTNRLRFEISLDMPENPRIHDLFAEAAEQAIRLREEYLAYRRRNRS